MNYLGPLDIPIFGVQRKHFDMRFFRRPLSLFLYSYAILVRTVICTWTTIKTIGTTWTIISLQWDQQT